MAGRLGEWSVEDLLQIAKITRKTTSIELVGDARSGVIFLRDGALVHAELTGEAAPVGDHFSCMVEVVGSLASIDEGTFSFGTQEVPSHTERPIDVKALFAAIENDLAREKRLSELGINAFDGLGMVRHVSDPLSLKPAAWQLICDLVPAFSVADLERRLGRRRAVAVVITLEALGILARSVEPSAGEDEDDADQPRSSGEASWLEDSHQPTGPDEFAVGERIEQSDLFLGASPVVEVFGAPGTMHEVLAPSEMTLVSDVLGDLRSRFRSGSGQTLEPDDES